LSKSAGKVTLIGEAKFEADLGDAATRGRERPHSAVDPAASHVVTDRTAIASAEDSGEVDRVHVLLGRELRKAEPLRAAMPNLVRQRSQPNRRSMSL
jgi:hypothetical protein